MTKSLVAISFFDGEMNGVISTDEGQFDVGKIDNKRCACYLSVFYDGI